MKISLSNKFKKFGGFFLKILMCGFALFVFGIFILKKNEIHDVIFSKETGEIALSILVGIIIFIAGCVYGTLKGNKEERSKYNTLNKQHNSLIKKYNQLKTQYNQCADLLQTATNWISFYENQENDNNAKKAVEHSNAILSEISKFDSQENLEEVLQEDSSTEKSPVDENSDEEA